MVTETSHKGTKTKQGTVCLHDICLQPWFPAHQLLQASVAVDTAVSETVDEGPWFFVLRCIKS